MQSHKLAFYHTPIYLSIQKDSNTVLSRPEGKNYNGQKLESDLKSFEEMKQEVSNVKYRKAVLQEKVANLEIVAAHQRKLLQDSEKFKAEKCQIVMIDGQLDNLKEKLKRMKPVLEEIENNDSENSGFKSLQQKRTLEIEEAILSKKMRLANQKAEIQI